VETLTGIIGKIMVSFATVGVADDQNGSASG
jgi:hypothetical protein